MKKTLLALSAVGILTLAGAALITSSGGNKPTTAAVQVTQVKPVKPAGLEPATQSAVSVPEEVPTQDAPAAHPEAPVPTQPAAPVEQQPVGTDDPPLRPEYNRANTGAQVSVLCSTNCEN